jgi:RNA polymerase sigma-70 factor (ECF subfamily)
MPDPPAAASETIDALVDAAQSGSQRAWEALVKQYWRKVFNVAYKFVGRHDEAEDLAQDIFFKIFRALHTFDRRANFQTWLISISRNFCIDHYRSVRKERELVDRSMDAADVSPVAPAVDPTARLEQADRRALLRKAMAELPDTLRTAVLLRDIQELAYQEIATRLKLPEGTVKSRINRGRRELARQIVRLEEEQHRTLAAARQSAAGSSGVLK